MKLYTVKYDGARPNPACIETPLDSNFAVGVGPTENFDTIKLFKDNVEISSANVVAGNQVFEISTDSNVGMDEYDVRTSKDGAEVSFKLYIKKADKGEIYGYDEQPAVDVNTITVSGTDALDKHFSYDFYIKN